MLAGKLHGLRPGPHRPGGAGGHALRAPAPRTVLLLLSAGIGALLALHLLLGAPTLSKEHHTQIVTHQRQQMGGGPAAPYKHVPGHVVEASTTDLDKPGHGKRGASSESAIPPEAIAAAEPLYSTKPEEPWRAVARTAPFTIITGASSNYFHGMKNFVGSVHFWCPTCNIAVYDLGLIESQVQEIKQTWCNVPVHSLKERHIELQKYAWKPQVMLDAVERYGVVVWLDAGCVITGPLDEIERQVRSEGVWNVQGQDDDMTVRVAQGSFDYFNASREWFRMRPSFAGGLWGWVRGSPYIEHILKPWVECSMLDKCISPPGSSLANHRFDQSVVSIITYTTATTVWPNGTTMFTRVCPKERNNGECPPPLGLRVMPRTDLLAANSGQLNASGCYEASRMVIWTARQGCACYTKDAQNCSALAQRKAAALKAKAGGSGKAGGGGEGGGGGGGGGAGALLGAAQVRKQRRRWWLMRL